MTDKQLMIRLLTNLKFYLGELEKKKKVSSEEYKGNYDFQAIIERRLQKAIETCIDMGNHIISDENLRPAKGYRDVFLLNLPPFAKGLSFRSLGEGGG